MRIKLQDQYKEHSWFTWRPIKVKNQIIWLETVMRKRRIFDARSRWEYTLISKPFMCGKEVRHEN